MCATMLTTMTARDKASGSKHPVNTSFIQVALVIVCFLTAIRQWLGQKSLLFSFVFSKNPFIYNLAYPSLFSFPLISFLIGNGLIIPFYKKIMIVTPISLKLIVHFSIEISFNLTSISFVFAKIITDSLWKLFTAPYSLLSWTEGTFIGLEMLHSTLFFITNKQLYCGIHENYSVVLFFHKS